MSSTTFTSVGGGTSANHIPFSQTSGGSQLVQGSGITITGNTIALTVPVTVALGGTGATSAGIAAFNNITGYTASGATGTTSTNLVFSTSPTIASPTFSGTVAGVNTIPLSILAQTATNTVLVNATSGTANVTAQAVSGCSALSDALIWTTNMGFGCNTAIAASTVTTNANLTGVITSSGNATSTGAQTGTGKTFVMSASPTITGTLTATTRTASGVLREILYLAAFGSLDQHVNLYAVAVASNTYRVVLVHASCPCTIAAPAVQRLMDNISFSNFGKARRAVIR